MNIIYQSAPANTLAEIQASFCQMSIRCALIIPTVFGKGCHSVMDVNVP